MDWIQAMHTGVALTWLADSVLEGAIAIILYFPIASDLEVSCNVLMHGRVHLADMADSATTLWSCQCSGKLDRTVRIFTAYILRNDTLRCEVPQDTSEQCWVSRC